MQTNNKEIVVLSIKSGLRAFYELAYMKAYRGSWYKKLSHSQQLQVGRAMFALRDIAAAPETHFSREATESQWRTRGKEYAKSHGMAEEWASYYIVPSAADMVREKVQDWYYNSTSAEPKGKALAQTNGEDIIAMSKRITNDCSIEKDGRVVHYINKFLESSMVQRLLITGYSKQK